MFILDLFSLSLTWMVKISRLAWDNPVWCLLTRRNVLLQTRPGRKRRSSITTSDAEHQPPTFAQAGVTGPRWSHIWTFWDQSEKFCTPRYCDGVTLSCGLQLSDREKCSAEVERDYLSIFNSKYALSRNSKTLEIVLLVFRQFSALNQPRSALPDSPVEHKLPQRRKMCQFCPSTIRDVRLQWVKMLLANYELKSLTYNSWLS